MENKYNISIIKKAEKFIKTQDKDTQRRIVKAIKDNTSTSQKNIWFDSDVFKFNYFVVSSLGNYKNYLYTI